MGDRADNPKAFGQQRSTRLRWWLTSPIGFALMVIALVLTAEGLGFGMGTYAVYAIAGVVFLAMASFPVYWMTTRLPPSGAARKSQDKELKQ